jgi:Tol biopolymer transport system component
MSLRNRIFVGLLVIALIFAVNRRNDDETRVRAEGPSETTTTTAPAGYTSTTEPASPPTTNAPTAVGACAHGERPIVFSRTTRAGAPVQHVFTVRRDGTCLTQVTQGDAHVLNWGGSLSPDGTQVAFVRKDVGVMVANADGSGERLLLAETKVQPSAARTQWSPDGRSIVAGRQEGVWTVEVATGKALQLAASPNAMYPSWSPDGQFVVFSDYLEEGGFTIDVIARDGTGRHQIGKGGNDPYWSVKNKIVYSNGTRLLVMNGDGGGVTPVPNSENLGMPIWSPDGEWIVASRGPGSMVVLRPDGSGMRELSTAAEDYAFGWA